MIFSVQAMQGHLKTRNFDGEKPGILMGILAVHITTVKIRDTKGNQASLGHLGHPGQIGVGWVPQNDVTMEAVRADGYFPTPPVIDFPPVETVVSSTRSPDLNAALRMHGEVQGDVCTLHGFVTLFRYSNRFNTGGVGK